MLSIIIPTLNESKFLPQLLTSLSKARQESVEVIVVDGGSVDETVNIAKSFGVRVVQSVKGRGNQIHRGVQESSGDILLFLHADSTLTSQNLQALESALEKEAHIIGGNFRLVFDGDEKFSKNLTVFYHWMRKFGLYYGDSGIFVRREIYEELGGIRQIPIMEDYDFVRRLENYQTKFRKTHCIIEPPLVTSSRKFEGRNFFQIIGLWIKMHSLFLLKKSPDQLSKIYETF